MVRIRDVDLGSDLEQLIVRDRDGDRNGPSKPPSSELPKWARYIVDQVCWFTVEVMSLRA